MQFGILTQERMLEILAETTLTETTTSVYIEANTIVYSAPTYADKTSGTYLMDQMVECYVISDLSKTANAGFFPAQIIETQSEVIE